MTADIIFEHFPNLTDKQKEQFAALDALYRDWNAKINVISRKDIDNLYVNHVLHSLAIAKVVKFRSGAKILDLGTGGGFPGIPLAILFPETEFYLVDGIAKKIRVCNEVIQGIGLTNCKADQKRAEEIKKPIYDFVVTRAVAKMEKLAEWRPRAAQWHLGAEGCWARGRNGLFPQRRPGGIPDQRHLPRARLL